MSPQISVLIELTAILILWMFAIWGGWFIPGFSFWQGPAFLLLVLVIVLSILIRKPGWKSSGFRIDNLGPALVQTAVGTAAVLILMTIVVKLQNIPFRPPTGRQIVDFFLRGTYQEMFFMGFLFYRWQALLGTEKRAVWANAASFAFVHVPNPAFMLLTALGGLFFSELFRRVKNVLAVGLAHGALVLFVFCTWRGEFLLDGLRIGPPQLAPISKTILEIAKSDERIGMGTHSLVPRHFDPRISRRVEKIGGKFDVGNDEINRNLLKNFFNDQKRVFCLISTRDYRRYVSPELGERLFVLDEQYVWRRKFEFNRALLKDFLSTRDDFVILGGLRDKILLISNQK